MKFEDDEFEDNGYDNSKFPAVRSNGVSHKCDNNMNITLWTTEGNNGEEVTLAQLLDASPVDTSQPGYFGNNNTSAADIAKVRTGLDGHRGFFIWPAIQAEVLKEDGSSAGTVYIPDGDSSSAVWQTFVRSGTTQSGSLLPHNAGTQDIELLHTKEWNEPYNLSDRQCELAKVFGPSSTITFKEPKDQLLVPYNLTLVPLN